MTPSNLARPLAGLQWERWSTTVHLMVTDAAQLNRARRVLEAELDAIEMAASRFRRDSEISALAAGRGERRDVSPVLADLIDAALGAARLTDGDVDPTVGNAVIKLGYDHSFDDDGAPVAWVSSVTMPVDWTAVDFDGHSVRMPAGTLLDLGATAKAVAADRGAQRIAHDTGTGVLVNLGGDIATAGPAPEGGWRVLVQDTQEDPACEVTIGTDTGLATSSTQRRRWRSGSSEHHHIVDPRTGASAASVWRTVSVAAQSCLAANTVSTAAIVRGRRALDWIAALEVPARLVDADGRVTVIGGWPS